MPTYKYEATRSTAKADQVKGIECAAGVIGGVMTAPLRDVRQFVYSLLIVPGKWTLRFHRGAKLVDTEDIIVEMYRSLDPCANCGKATIQGRESKNRNARTCLNKRCKHYESTFFLDITED